MTLSGTYTVHVEWGDCDAAGIVFYPNYYRWYDASTHALLGGAGLTIRDAQTKHGVVGFPLVSTHADYRSASTYGDTIAVTSEVTKVGGKSFTVQHRLHVGERLVVEGYEVRVWAAAAPGGGLDARPIPDEVRRILEG